MQTEPKREGSATSVLVFGTLVAVLLAAIPIGFYIYRFGSWDLSEELPVWAQFGDYVGGIGTPIFGSVTLVVLVYTLYLQGRELKNSSAQLGKSAEALTKQNFEQTFFQLLNRFDLVSRNVAHGEMSGPKAIAMYCNSLATIIRQASGESIEEKVINGYQTFYNANHGVLGHYFRTLYHIFKFVDDSSLDDDQKYLYAKLARAQLSSHELVLLYYNGVYGEGKEGFKPLVEQYSLLKHARKDLVCSKDVEFDLTQFYPKSAFSIQTCR